MNNKPKIYRLLKDTLWGSGVFIKAGTVFTADTEHAMCWEDSRLIWYSLDAILSNIGEWFEEIKEPESEQRVEFADGRWFTKKEILFFIRHTLGVNIGAKYTQEELDKAIVDAFKAAGLSFSRMGKNFDSAEDYLKSLKK